MLKSLFSANSHYKKQARFLAILWTLLILLGCFAPAKAFPEVDVPFIDKWVHFILFGGFSFLWLLSNPALVITRLITMFIIAVAFGAAIEIMQGILTFLGRSMEFMDAVADAIGGLLGIGLFALCSFIFKK